MADSMPASARSASPLHASTSSAFNHTFSAIEALDSRDPDPDMFSRASSKVRFLAGDTTVAKGDFPDRVSFGLRNLEGDGRRLLGCSGIWGGLLLSAVSSLGQVASNGIGVVVGGVDWGVGEKFGLGLVVGVGYCVSGAFFLGSGTTRPLYQSQT